MAPPVNDKGPWREVCEMLAILIGVVVIGSLAIVIPWAMIVVVTLMIWGMFA